MSSLFGTMSIALQSMNAEQAAMGVVANNIANQNTPGYTREVANFQEAPPILSGNTLVGTGVTLQSVQSVRDNILDLRIDQETAQQSNLNTYVSSMNQVQALFNETQGTGLQTDLSNFFNSFQSLTTDPTSSPLRQAVLTAGQDLADAFNESSQNLSTIQQGLDQNVTQTVRQINTLTGQLASLNQQITNISNSGANPGSLEDQRDLDLNNLSNLIDIGVVYQGDGSVSVTTSNGTELVAGNVSNTLTTQANSSTGMHDVYAQGTDITSSIAGGELAGYINARDNSIPQAQSSLDNLAAGIVAAVNTQQTAGYDVNGNQGMDFFTPFTPGTPGSNAGAASVMSVALTSPDQVAASASATNAGDNTNATALANLANQPIVAGQTAASYYSDMVDTIGNQVSNATSEQEAVGLVLQQLQTQQGSISGVSLDEEATNLVKYQQAYEASAKVISTVDTMTQSTLDMFTPEGT